MSLKSCGKTITLNYQKWILFVSTSTLTQFIYFGCKRGAFILVWQKSSLPMSCWILSISTFLLLIFTTLAFFVSITLQWHPMGKEDWLTSFNRLCMMTIKMLIREQLEFLFRIIRKNALISVLTNENTKFWRRVRRWDFPFVHLKMGLRNIRFLRSAVRALRKFVK